MNSIKIILKILPWFLLMLAILLWSLGIKLPGKKQNIEIINSTTILEKIEPLGKMELVKYKFKEIYDYKSISEGRATAETLLKSYNFTPDLKAILIASGEAVGCIDLTKIEERDIRVTGDTLFIRLPEPELCYHKLDLENTSIYHFERSGWFSKLFGTDQEMKGVIEKAYKNAEQQIRKSALEAGILEQTKENANLVLKPMLEKMSGKVVVLKLPMESVDVNRD